MKRNESNVRVPAPGRRTRVVMSVGAPLALLATGVACSASPTIQEVSGTVPPTAASAPATTPGTTRPGTTAPGTTRPSGPGTTLPNAHQLDLSEGETRALAAELVTVPGYEYVDVADAERQEALANLPDSATGATFHGVREDGAREELAFLSLMVLTPDDAMHSPSYAERFGQFVLETDDVTALDFSGQQVWFAEDPSRPMSQFQYTWLRHGTVGWLDGPERGPAEEFLEAYFAAPFRGVEGPLLGQHMVDVPGFAYTNAVDRARGKDVAEELFPAATASMHYVFDTTHSFGGLVLVGPVEPPSDRQLRDAVAAWFTKSYDLPETPGLQVGPDIDVGGVRVLDLRVPASDSHTYVWYRPDTKVVGWFTTTRPDIAADWLAAFVAAPPRTLAP